MQLVFVHGVNVREGELYDREVEFRNRHFTEIFFRQLGGNGSEKSIHNPYWGDLGAKISDDQPFLPRGAYEMLWRKLSNQEEKASSEHTPLQSETPLLDIARTASVADVIDVLWDLVDQSPESEGEANKINETQLAQLAQRALNFVHSKEGEAWLQTVRSDDELIERLSNLLDEGSHPTGPAKGNESISDRWATVRAQLRSRSKSLNEQLAENVAAARLNFRQKAVSTTARLINNPLRSIFHQECALLIGDAFAYFSERGDADTPSPIAKRVLDSIEHAASEKKENEELIVVGHSMGGVILCDIVTCYGKHVPIDVVVTVGSQFPLFADLMMFPGVDAQRRPVPKPENVGKWINIFDPHDFLGYPASHIFSDVTDYNLPTYSIGGSAHRNYFNRRSFYFQLARRLSGLAATTDEA